DRASELLAKAVDYRPQDVALQFRRAEAFAQTGALDQAVRCYEKAVELYPDHSGAWARLAHARKALGRPEEAKQARRRGAEISPALGSPERVKVALVLPDIVRKEGLSPWRDVDAEIGSRLLEESYLFDEAIDYLRRAALKAASPEQSGAVQTLASASLRRG